MERRLYFMVGDLLAVTVVGALAGVLMTAVIGTGWNMLVAMLVGMALGMLVALPGSFAFMPFFGAMEVMVPTMLAGMLSGMWVGMFAAMTPLSAGAGLRFGALIGLFAWLCTTTLNAFLQAKEGTHGS